MKIGASAIAVLATRLSNTILCHMPRNELTTLRTKIRGVIASELAPAWIAELEKASSYLLASQKRSEQRDRAGRWAKAIQQIDANDVSHPLHAWVSVAAADDYKTGREKVHAGLRVKEAKAVTRFVDFRRELVLTAVLTILCGLALAFLSVGRVQTLARESEARYREVVLAREELHRLSARLVSAQEEERRKLSRELHDEVGQAMSALLVELGNLDSALPPEDDALHRRLQAVRNQARERAWAAGASPDLTGLARIDFDDDGSFSLNELQQGRVNSAYFVQQATDPRRVVRPAQFVEVSPAAPSESIARQLDGSGGSTFAPAP